MSRFTLACLLSGGLLVAACAGLTKGVQTDPSVRAQQGSSFSDETDAYMKQLFDEGKQIFRHDTFGSEAFWGDQLHLHLAILGDKQGGVGSGISPRAALKLGLKVDEGAMPKAAIEMVKGNSTDLDEPKTTLALLKAVSSRLESSALSVTRRLTIRLPQASDTGSTDGRTVISMSEPSSRARRT